MFAPTDSGANPTNLDARTFINEVTTAWIYWAPSSPCSRIASTIGTIETTGLSASTTAAVNAWRLHRRPVQFVRWFASETHSSAFVFITSSQWVHTNHRSLYSSRRRSFLRHPIPAPSGGNFRQLLKKYEISTIRTRLECGVAKPCNGVLYKTFFWFFLFSSHYFFSSNLARWYIHL